MYLLLGKNIQFGKEKMSADSPRRGVHKGVQVVSPQPIVDRSIIDSVAGIINDIVPQVGTLKYFVDALLLRYILHCLNIGLYWHTKF